MKKFSLTLSLLIMLVITLTACGSKDTSTNQNNTTGPITLKVALGSMTPSEDMIVSPSNPNPVVIPYMVAQAFMEENPDIKIVFDRSITYKSKDEWNSYMVTNLSSGRAPDIVFGWNGEMLYKDWYVDLTSYLDTKNEYEEGNECWKSMYPEYIFNSITSIDDKIMGIPITMFPGTATAYYYNKELFSKFEAPYNQVPKTWQQLVDLNVYIRNNFSEITTFGTNKYSNIKQLANNWDMQFVLGPAYGLNIKGQLDLDGNDLFSPLEMSTAILDNVISTTTGPNKDAGRDFWMNIRKKYTEILPKGYASADFEKLWNEGKLAIMEDGLWRLTDEIASAKRKDNFEFDLVPAPIIGNDSTTSAPHIGQIQTTVGPYQTPLQEAFHIVKPSLQHSVDKQNNEQRIIEASIKFLKYFTATENLNEIVREKKGGSLGATMGSLIPTELNEFLQNDFPKIETFKWIPPLTAEGQSNVTRLMQDWFSIKSPTQAENDKFFADLDAIYRNDTLNYMEKINFDTSKWE